MDVDRGTAQRRPVPLAREILDLEPIEADGIQAAAVNALIAERVAAVRGGIADKVVRLRVQNIPRHVARELDHAAIRALKADALHFHLDLRRPEIQRAVGIGAPGRRQTLPELVHSYLERRPLPAELDREAFVRLGDSAHRRRRARAGRLMQIHRLRLCQFPPARAHRARARRGPDRHRRPERRGQDDHSRGHRVGDVRHARRAWQPRDHSPARRAAPVARGGRDGVQPRRASVPHRPHLERRRAVPGRRSGADRELDRGRDRAGDAPARHDARGVLQYLLHRAEGARGHGGDDRARARAVPLAGPGLRADPRGPGPAQGAALRASRALRRASRRPGRSRRDRGRGGARPRARGDRAGGRTGAHANGRPPPTRSWPRCARAGSELQRQREAALTLEAELRVADHRAEAGAERAERLGARGRRGRCRRATAARRSSSGSPRWPRSREEVAGLERDAEAYAARKGLLAQLEDVRRHLASVEERLAPAARPRGPRCRASAGERRPRGAHRRGGRRREHAHRLGARRAGRADQAPGAAGPVPGAQGAAAAHRERRAPRATAPPAPGRSAPSTTRSSACSTGRSRRWSPTATSTSSASSSSSSSPASWTRWTVSASRSSASCPR